MSRKRARRPRPQAAEEEKWLTCNGAQLKMLAAAGLAHLERNQQQVNELNVFPVPDGDTGTNMVLTMQAAYKRIQQLPEQHVGRVAAELSQGALMGARGNSGVILSQIWRGLARPLKDSPFFDGQGLAAAFQEASATAYNGVMRPVEGTILTVIREAAEEAGAAAAVSPDLLFILARVVGRAQQALARTPDLLPVLKQAGVVDAGGQGLVFILEGMLRHVHGERTEMAELAPAAVVPAQALAAPAEGLEFPYDVQFILMGPGLSVEKVRADIGVMGDSSLVVGDPAAIKVHVHVKDPGVPLSYAIAQGAINDVVVENMQLQMETIIAGAPPAEAAAELPPPAEAADQIGVVAVASGEGLARIFRELGAAGVVDGGQSNNPSTEEILGVVESLPAERVIILPNNKNIILAAEAVGELTAKQVQVVPTRTIPQGISALLALDPKSELDAAAQAMAQAGRQVASGEIAMATRSVVLDGINVREGETVGLADGRLCACSADVEEVLRDVLAGMAAGERELVSVYYGRDVSSQQAAELAERIRALYPDVAVEVLPGGQSIYHYILGAE
ncbi:MAG: DAK2 domain-containing protein [Candidatus Promineifilaceae bacterium]